MNEHKVDLSLFNNNSYQPGTKLKLFFWYFINIIFFINPFNPFSEVKVLLLRAFGARIGKGVIIKPSVNIKYPWKLQIGNFVWIGENVWIDNLANIIIEDNVCISQGAMLLCGNHDYKKKGFDLMIGQIILENGCWVGAKSVVCPNVTLKTHSILAVGSVAKNNLEEYSIYQGNPAILIRKRIIEN